MLSPGRQNRWILHCFLWLACSPFAQAARAPEIIKVGVFAMPPFVNPGPGAPHGVMIDFFDREIAPRMGVRFQWERPMTMARLERSLANGSVTFTPILGKTPAREKAAIRFAGDVHISLDPCLAVLPDSPLQHVSSPADLAGLSIGWVLSGALPQFMQDKRLRFDRIGNVDWASANLEKLRLGRIDAAYFSNPYTPQFYSAQLGTPVRIIFLPTRGLKLYGAFAPNAARGLAERYERAADAAFANGRFLTYINRAVAAQVLMTPPKPD
jgi:ABC-type amino acid transport substrate-binding protein